MEAICVKLDKGIMKVIDEISVEFNYTTRTDFIREAIRDKIRYLQRERAIKKLGKYLGASKTHTSDKQLEDAKERAADKIFKEFGL